MVVLLILLLIGAFVWVIIWVYREMTKDQPSRLRRATWYDANAAQAAPLPPTPEHVAQTTHVAPAGRPTPGLSPDECWIAPGQDIIIAGRSIRGGMLYVGSGLSALSEYHGVEPALIDPNLPLAQHADTTGHGMRYWPSYQEISPQCRAAYLDWLASGRNDPNAYIGYVFLYFYGLERRLLAATSSSQRAATEAPALLGEVDRLLRTYGSNGSFQAYASKLLAVATIVTEGAMPSEFAPPADASVGELPLWTSDFQAGLSPAKDLKLRFGLARIVVARRPIPWDWALGWYLWSDQRSLRTPAWRCSDEFKALFRLRYGRRWGDGILVKPNKTPLRLSYHPASQSFGGEVKLRTEGLPDVTALTRPLSKISTLADECVTELDPYSRWLGRHPSSKKTLAALAFLPKDLAAEVACPQADALRSCLDEMIGQSGTAAMKAEGLISRWPAGGKSGFAKRDAVGLAQALGHCGFGIEPDVRFGGQTPKPEDWVVVFRQPSDAPQSPSQGYRAAALILHLFIAVAKADGEVHRAEHEQLIEHLKSTTNLTAGERLRLKAHARRLVKARPGFRGMKKRAEALTTKQRQALGALLVGVAGADGVIAGPEIRALTKAYGLLGLDPEDVHSDIHALAAGDQPPTEPVTVAVAGRQRRGRAIPPAPTEAEAPVEGIVLDMERVQARLRETEHVAVLLGDILGEEEPAPSTLTPECQAGESIAGLDPAHSAFLRKLVEHDELDRETLEEYASECCLYPDGALDTINDATLEMCDECVCEGDEVVEINRDVLKGMLA